MNSKQFPEFMNNGRIFPLWVLKNYKKYKLEPIILNDEDPCKHISTDNVKELRKFQKFIGSFLDFRSPYHDVLIYYGVGAGKTATIINIYNMLYNYNKNWNVFLLIKASLEKDPWLKELKIWLNKNNYDLMFNNIKFIHYDAPNASKDFLEKVKTANIQNKNLYIIDEVHNFINNVYNNIVSKTGYKAFTIYEYIKKEKEENSNTRIILGSGTPAINNPFELALLFNLLRPNIFPASEVKFNELYLKTDGSNEISDINKNMFQRRILGLTSYYKGSTSNLFAKKIIKIKKLVMDQIQENGYNHYQLIEDQLAKKRMGTKIYKSYTRQASNFIFPYINKKINGENRPRPSKFKLKDEDVEKILENNEEYVIKLKEKGTYDKTKNDILIYLQSVKEFLNEFKIYLNKIKEEDIKNKNTILDDLDVYINKYKCKFKRFWNEYKKKSNLLKLLYSCSCKMVYIIFKIFKIKGPVMIYSNYIKMEGFDIFKIYLDFINIIEFKNDKNNKNLTYIEYNGTINQSIRSENLKYFNQDANLDGSIIKLILISPAGSEGINLMNVRQVHILEPYWNEIRIEQVIGRAVRQCSHKLLPINDRFVVIYRYLSTINNKTTTDEEIYELATKKNNLIQTFLDCVKETAIDCELFKNHNMIDDKYECFKFNQESYFNTHIGPAFKYDLYYDEKLNNGLNSVNSIIKEVKVYKIKAVYSINEEIYSEAKYYWYDNISGIVYDEELDFPIGKILLYDGLPNRLDNETYIISHLIDIPEIKVI